MTQQAPVELEINSTKLIRYTIGFAIFAELMFVVLDYHVNYGRLTEIGAMRRMTNIAREDGFASWFGTAQLTLISVTLWLIYFAVREHASKFRRVGWLVLACFFTYMTLDDGNQLHERFGTLFGTLARRASEPGEGLTLTGKILDFFPSYHWQVLFLPMFAAAGLFILYFLWREVDDRSSRRLVVAAIVLFIVAVGLDFIEGLSSDHRLNIYRTIADRYDLSEFTQARFRHTPYETLVHFSKSIEECIEMMGNSFLWMVFLRQFVRIAADLRVRFQRVSA